MPDNITLSSLESLVSRETKEKLRQYDALLHKWQKTINLVSPTTLKNSWERHVLDSLQLLPLIPKSARVLVDMGSGAGFPGLIVAIARPKMDVHLIESDKRKGSFLRQIKTKFGLRNVTIHNRRIETPPKVLLKSADIVTARALASLDALLEWAEFYLNTINPDRVCIFPKGRSFQDEIVSLQSTHTHQAEAWIFDCHKSLTEAEAALVVCQPK